MDSGFIPDVSCSWVSDVNQRSKSSVLIIQLQAGSLFELFLQE